MISEPAYQEKPRFHDVAIIAIPMVVSMASETVNLFVDRLFLSRLGKLYLSGAMTGGLTNYMIMSFFLGIIGYVNAIVAQNDGAGRPRQCARAASQSLRLAVLAWPLVLASIPLVRMAFVGLGHGPEQVNLEMTYFRILIFGSIFGFLRQALGGFFIGLGKTRVVMVSNIAGMIVNIPANWALIFGKLGLPALGITGAAIGTVLGSLVTMLILASIYVSRHYRETYGTTSELGFDRRLAGLLFRYGTPAGFETFLNMAAFNLFVQLMHSYGPDTAAAVTITFNYDMLAFIPMMGLGFAATTLTGRYVGAKNIGGAEEATRLNLRTALGYAATLVVFFMVAARPLVELFADGLEGGGVEVAAQARIMLRLAAVYILADATQLILAGSLRGAGDTKYVMWISVILHWIFAVLAWVFVRTLRIPPVTMWIIFIGFVLVLGSAMYLRYRFGPWRKMSLVEN